MRHFHPCSSLDFGTAAKTMKQETVQIPRHSAMHTKTAANALGLTNNIVCQTEYQWHNCYMQQHSEAEIAAPGNASKARDPQRAQYRSIPKEFSKRLHRHSEYPGRRNVQRSLWEESSEMCTIPQLTRLDTHALVAPLYLTEKSGFFFNADNWMIPINKPWNLLRFTSLPPKKHSNITMNTENTVSIFLYLWTEISPFSHCSLWPTTPEWWLQGPSCVPIKLYLQSR